jgi:hypothetical protein
LSTTGRAAEVLGKRGIATGNSLVNDKAATAARTLPCQFKAFQAAAGDIPLTLAQFKALRTRSIVLFIYQYIM